MAQVNNNNLIWIDMEMSGLIPDSDRILEVALVVTDSQLNVVAEAPVLAVHQSDSILDNMDKWNKSTHAKSGLIDKVKGSKLNEDEIEKDMIAFLQKHSTPKYFSDVWQYYLSGPTFPGSYDAKIRSVLSLP